MLPSCCSHAICPLIYCGCVSYLSAASLSSCLLIFLRMSRAVKRPTTTLLPYKPSIKPSITQSIHQTINPLTDGPIPSPSPFSLCWPHLLLLVHDTRGGVVVAQHPNSLLHRGRVRQLADLALTLTQHLCTRTPNKTRDRQSRENGSAPPRKEAAQKGVRDNVCACHMPCAVMALHCWKSRYIMFISVVHRYLLLCLCLCLCLPCAMMVFIFFQSYHYFDKSCLLICPCACLCLPCAVMTLPSTRRARRRSSLPERPPPPLPLPLPPSYNTDNRSLIQPFPPTPRQSKGYKESGRFADTYYAPGKTLCGYTIHGVRLASTAHGVYASTPEVGLVIVERSFIWIVHYCERCDSHL